MIDPVALASITAAVSVIANEYFKNMASEAAKSTWEGVKKLFGWNIDPVPAEVPFKVATALTASPDLVEKLLEIIKADRQATSSAMVGNIDAKGGKVIVATTIVTDTFQM